MINTNVTTEKMTNINLKKEKWIVDTDPGCDDMMALLYLLNKPEAEVLMLGTIDGNVCLEHTTNNMKKILKWSSKHNNKTNIPIHRGSAFPILKVYENIQSFHFCDGLGDIEQIQNFDASEIKVDPVPSAIKIVEYILKYPGEINLLLLGPLTNIATAFMLNPEIGNLVKNVYIMGGSFNSRGNQNSSGEFNFAYDFIAAKIVISNFKNIILTPWEPTENIYIKNQMFEVVRKNLTSENILINEDTFSHSELIVKKFSEKMKGIQFCDLYCAMTIFNRSTVKSYFYSQVDIVIDSPSMYGTMIVKNKLKGGQDLNAFLASEEYKKSRHDSHLIVEEFDEIKVLKEFEIVFHA